MLSYLRASSFLALPLVAVAMACSVTSTTNGTPSPSEDASAFPEQVADAATPDAAVAPSDDAGPTTTRDDAASDAAPSNVTTLEIDDAIYETHTSVDNEPYFGLNLTLKNVGATDVTSLDTLSFDFGGGKEVHLTKSVCSGSFAIAAGESAPLQIQIEVDATSGNESFFSFVCEDQSQIFGGATGSAPVSAFTSPIAVKAGGKTTDGTFEATGSATHVDNLP